MKKLNLIKNKNFKFYYYFISGSLAYACETDQMGTGCRIFNAQCSCGYGCKAEYRYDSNEACKMALRGGTHQSMTFSIINSIHNIILVNN